MRTILGALIGLGLGIALITVLAVSGSWDGYWTMIPVGLVVGIAMRVIASSGKASIGRGVLALVAALGAMPLGQIVSAQVIKSQKPTSSAPASAVAASEGSSSESSSDTPAAVSETASREVDRSTSSSAGPTGSIGAPQSGETSPIDIVCLVVGALLSYQLGKGPEAAHEEAAEEGSPSDGDDAAAPESDDSGEEG